MRKKTDWKKLTEDLLAYWMKDHKGLGIKKYQLNGSNIEESKISRILRDLRHDKKVKYCGRRCWFLTEEAYKQLKEKYGKQE